LAQWNAQKKKLRVIGNEGEGYNRFGKKREKAWGRTPRGEENSGKNAHASTLNQR